MNRFAYVYNDPVNYIDLDGRHGASLQCYGGLYPPHILETTFCRWEEQNRGEGGGGPGGGGGQGSGRGSAAGTRTADRIWRLAENPCNGASAIFPEFGDLGAITRSMLGSSGQGRWSGLSNLQKAAFLNIAAALQDALDLNSDTIRSILGDLSVVDFSNGGVAQDRVFFTGGQALFATLLHTSGWQNRLAEPNSLRQLVNFGSLEITYSGDGLLNIDIAYFNAFNYPADHAQEVAHNIITGELTNPFAVYRILTSGIQRGAVQPEYQCEQE